MSEIRSNEIRSGEIPQQETIVIDMSPCMQDLIRAGQEAAGGSVQDVSFQSKDLRDRVMSVMNCLDEMPWIRDEKEVETDGPEIARVLATGKIGGEIAELMVELWIHPDVCTVMLSVPLEKELPDIAWKRMLLAVNNSTKMAGLFCRESLRHVICVQSRFPAHRGIDKEDLELVIQELGYVTLKAMAMAKTEQKLAARSAGRKQPESASGERGSRQ